MRNYGTSCITEETIDPNTQKFLEWADHHVFSTTATNLFSKTGVVVVSLIGGVSAYVMYPLGAGFGDTITKNTFDILKEISKFFFGIGAIAPMTALGVITAQDYFRAFLLRKKNDNSNNKNSIKQKLKICAYVLGATSAIPQSYLTYKYLHNSVFRFIITPTAIITPTLFNSKAEISLIDKIYAQLTNNKTEITSQHRTVLLNKLHAAIHVISSEHSNTQIDELYQHLFINNTTINTHSKSRILRLLDLAQGQDTSIPQGKIRPFLREMIGFFGFALGATGAYAYYGLGEAAFLYVLALFDISIGDEPELVIKNIIGAMAYVPNAALSAERTQELFKKIFDKISTIRKTKQPTNWPKIRSAINVLSIFLGSLSATPLTYIQLLSAIGGSWIQKLLVAPTFLAPFSVRSDAINRLLNRLVDYIDHLLIYNSGTKRNQLVSATRAVQQKVQTLPDRQINGLFKDLVQNVHDVEQQKTIQTRNPKLQLFMMKELDNESLKKPFKLNCGLM